MQHSSNSVVRINADELVDGFACHLKNMGLLMNQSFQNLGKIENYQFPMVKLMLFNSKS